MDCVGGLSWFAVSRAGADRGVTDLPLGMLGGAFFLSYSVGCPAMGRLSDRAGRRRVMVSGLVVAWAALRWARRWEELWVGWAAMALFGLGMSAFWPPLIAWLGEGHAGRRLLDRLVIFSLAWNAGIMLGSGAAGWLYERDPVLPLDAAAALVVVAGAVLLWPARRDPLDAVAAPAAEQPAGEWGSADRRRMMLMGWLGEFASGAGMGTLGALFPQLAVARQVAPAVHGGLLGWARVTGLLTYLLLMKTRFWQFRVPVLVAAGGLTALGYLLVPVGPQAGAWWVAFAVAGVASAFFYLSSLYYSLAGSEAGREGAGSSAHEAVVGAGLLAGPLVGGLAARWWGIGAPYILVAVLFVLVAVLQTILAAGAPAAARAGLGAGLGEDEPSDAVARCIERAN